MNPTWIRITLSLHPCRWPVNSRINVTPTPSGSYYKLHVLGVPKSVPRFSLWAAFGTRKGIGEAGPKTIYFFVDKALVGALRGRK